MNTTLMIEIPEAILQAENSEPDTFVNELRMLAAVKLYELGRLSAERAAELAGVTRKEFSGSLLRYRASIVESVRMREELPEGLQELVRCGKARLGARNDPSRYPQLRPVLTAGTAQELLDAERGER